MKRTPVLLERSQIPERYHALLDGASVFDSSCSPAARVYLICGERALFLKAAPKGALEREAALARWLHQKGLAPEVMDYYSNGERDWLLTLRADGEDLTHRRYLEQPIRLCDAYAMLLRELHEASTVGCPEPDRTRTYCAAVEKNFRAGRADLSYLTSLRPSATVEDAWHIFSQNKAHLRSDTLIHGDYCLPNVILRDWQFSAFIDVGNGGVGDRHIDLYWGAWSLAYNLGTDAFRDRFFDAYGRDRVEQDAVLTVAAAEIFG